jgi:hypothetical protein
VRVKPTEFRLVAAPLASAPICTSIGSLLGLESVHEFGSSWGSPDQPLLPEITSDEGVDPYEDEDYLRKVPPQHG